MVLCQHGGRIAEAVKGALGRLSYAKSKQRREMHWTKTPNMNKQPPEQYCIRPLNGISVSCSFFSPHHTQVLCYSNIVFPTLSILVD